MKRLDALPAGPAAGHADGAVPSGRRSTVRHAGRAGGTAIADDPALVAFCERLYPQVVGSLTLLVGDRMIAEELAQETFVRVWERWPHVGAMDSPEGWAHHVATNLARSALRRRGAERRARRRLEARTTTDVASVDRDDVLTVRAALAALPLKQRAAVVLRYYAGLDVEATAEALGCAPGTVTSLCHRARQSLRDGLHARAETS